TAVHLPPIARHHGRSSTIVVSTMGPLIQNCHPCRSSTRPCALCAPRLPRRHASLRTNALPPLPTRWAPISRLLLSVTHLYLDRRLLCRFAAPFTRFHENVDSIVTGFLRHSSLSAAHNRELGLSPLETSIARLQHVDKTNPSGGDQFGPCRTRSEPT